MTKQNKLSELIIVAIFSFTVVVALLNFIAIELNIYDIRLYIILIMIMTLIYKPLRLAIFRFIFYSFVKSLLMIKNSLNKKEWMLQNLDGLDKLDGLEFDYFLKDIFEKYGFVAVVTKELEDFHTDLILWKGTKKYIVSTNQSNVTARIVQKEATKIHKYGADGVFIVTNQHFTNSAVKLAQIYDAKLMDREMLLNLTNAHDKKFIFQSALSFMLHR